MKAYGWTADYIRFDLIGAQGWVYYNWALENEASVWGSSIRPASAGYVKQEWNKLMERHNNGK
jgi:hypothetical protein